MAHSSTKEPSTVYGIDIGDKESAFCRLGARGSVQRRGSMPTTKKGLRKVFGKIQPARVVLEAGTHSRWMSSLLKELGHEVVVANPRRIALIYGDLKKNDDVDAEKLARLVRVDIELVSPIQHRSDKSHADLAVIKARGCLVEQRTQLVNHIRQTVKSFGVRLPKCSTTTFAKKVGELIPESLKPALDPLLPILSTLVLDIREYDKKIRHLSEKTYRETAILRQVPGVGPVTALSFVLTLEDPRRFPKSRTVGSYLGLVPRQDRSGETDRQLRITKAGNKDLRKLLVTCAQYILGWRGPDCRLRRHGEQISARGGKSAKKKAAVAVARKLAVLLHRLWLTGETYDPEHQPMPRKKKQRQAS